MLCLAWGCTAKVEGEKEEDMTVVERRMAIDVYIIRRVDGRDGEDVMVR
jgi:hypothetical protein